MKYTRCVLPWSFVHVCCALSGSSVQRTLVDPGQLPPKRVSCLLSKSLEDCRMAICPPAATSAKNTFSLLLPQLEMVFSPSAVVSAVVR